MSPGSARQAKPLQELSELYASAADAQEAAAASGDPALARERLQAVLSDIAGAASLPVTGEGPSPVPPFPRLSASSAPAAAAAEGTGSAPAVKKHRPRSWLISTLRATKGFIKTATK